MYTAGTLEVIKYCLWSLIVIAARAETWDTRPADTTVAQGQEVTFNCSGSTVRWIRNLATAPTVSLKLFESPDTWRYANHRDKFDVSGEYNLIVYNADARSDAGTYQCDAHESDHFFRANLVVIDDLSLSVLPPGYLEQGTQIVISCSVHYGASPVLDVRQDPALTLSVDNDHLIGQLYLHAPTDTDQLYTKTLEVNYTLPQATTRTHVRCRVTSLEYEQDTTLMPQIKFEPRIVSTFEAQYNASDSITCSAEGLPTPRVRWTRVSGDTSQHSAGTSSTEEGQAVLTQLENGAHTWTCTATSELGTDAVNVTFTVGSTKTAGGQVDSGDKIGPCLGLLIFVAVTLRLLFTRL